MKSLLKLLFAAGLCALSCAALAQAYPDRVIKIINPYAAGGTNAFFAEIVAQSLRQQFGQGVIVEPHPGAGGNIGSALAARADPDGYTLLAATSGSNAVNPSLYKNIPYDAKRDLRIVATLATVDNILVVGAKSPYKTVDDVIADAKAHPGTISYGSSGIGSVLHLCGAMMSHDMDVKMVHVPYNGAAPALVDVMGGRLNFMFANAPSVVSLIKGGKLRALAVTGTRRSEVFPDVPTMQEAGVAGFDLVSWYAIMAPYKTPAPVVAKLNEAIVKLLRSPDTKERFSAQSATPLIMDASQSEEFFLKELKTWAEVVKVSGAQVN